MLLLNASGTLVSLGTLILDSLLIKGIDHFEQIVQFQQQMLRYTISKIKLRSKF